MQHLFDYFKKYEQEFTAYLERLIGHHKATGQLPPIPEAPVLVPAPVPTPPQQHPDTLTADAVAAATLPNLGPAPPVVPIIHSLPAEPAADVVPAGTDTPDANGAVKFTAVEPGPVGQQRVLSVALLPSLDPNSYAYACVAINCKVAQIEHDTPGMLGGVIAAYPLVANTRPGAPAFGVGAWDLDSRHGAIPDTLALPSSLDTVAAGVAFINAWIEHAKANPGQPWPHP